MLSGLVWFSRGNIPAVRDLPRELGVQSELRGCIEHALTSVDQNLIVIIADRLIDAITVPKLAHDFRRVDDVSHAEDDAGRVFAFPKHLQGGQKFPGDPGRYVIHEEDVRLKDFGYLLYHRKAQRLHLFVVDAEIEWAVYSGTNFHDGRNLDKIDAGGRLEESSLRAPDH